MDKIGLPETIEALRTELREAVVQGEDQDIQFPVGGIQCEFQVAVTREGSGDAKVNVWVLQLGAGGRLAHESVHTVTVSLEAPVDRNGEPIQVRRRSAVKP
jgi:Trypsin-co-occurring domain 2